MAKEHDRHSMPLDYICRQSMELTYKLLSVDHTEIADVIALLLGCKAIPLKKIPHPSGEGLKVIYENQVLLQYFSGESVAKVVQALTALAKSAISEDEQNSERLLSHLQSSGLPTLNKPKLVMIIAHLINDWSFLVEWLLQNSTCTKAPANAPSISVH